MTHSRLTAALAAGLLALPLLAMAGPPARSQDYDRPPPGFGEDRDERAPLDAPDPAGLAVRMGRLEGRIRELTGQIEELQNANRRLTEQVQRSGADVDARGAAPATAHPKRSEADGGTTPTVADATPRKRRDDAFDPDTAPAGAPGRPKPLGSVAPAATAAATPDDGGAPMDLSGGKLRRSEGSNGDALAPTLQLPPTTPKASAGAVTPGGTVIANAAPPGTPREEYDLALGFYRDKQYETAEKGFTAFIQKNPKNRLVADATYYLGESFAQRGRSREAAEQYLKISTDFANSTRAPDAMLHLGVSLKAIGAKEQACATFDEIPRKYPNAPSYVRSGAEREAKRAQCPTG